MLGNAGHHHRRRGAACLRASYHQREMPPLDVRAADLETMVHSGREAGVCAPCAGLDAIDDALR